MSISGRTRLFAILGDPVSVVRSPGWWNALFARAGRDAVFVPMQVGAADLPRAWAGLRAIGNLDGLVLTMPHKQAAVPLVDVLGGSARLTGAVNTVRRLPDGGWEGEMFDGEGFVAGLRARGITPEGRHVRQKGCGGAGRAIAFALARAGVASLALEDAAPDRAASLAAEVAATFPAVARGGEPDLLVNATPLGLSVNDPLPFDPATLSPRVSVADVIPNPEVTPLIAAARAAGCATATGRDMFEGQARLAAAYFGIGA
ncbi:shikimate dehydrogenase [Roseomonas alkaliterrae]|uniref:Shikimate dehydrogenase n=1 Tax=Neoroseomonas alkaliterrae TaxID=1452450 RepID=A0A840Y0Y1_9PROT|nr:shikimate dehydrogenase [Neoroseomonas alkaliterrae]MBR0676701.1 shikimate dehydrogenase [Neoroseomonas alkaliterrae]